MKKGIIMKVSKNYITVLSESGRFENLKPKTNVAIGQEIYYFKNDRLTFGNKKAFSFASVAAAFMIVITLFAFLQYDFINVNAKTYAIVTVDINPSIELAIDKDNNVLSIKSLNEDGTKIVSKTIVGKSLNEALDYILQNAKENGFLLKQGSILIATAIVAKDSVVTDIYNSTVADDMGSGNEIESGTNNTENKNLYSKSNVANDYSEDNKDIVIDNDSNINENEDVNDSMSAKAVEDVYYNSNNVSYNSLDTFINQYMQNKTDEYSFVYIKGSIESLESANSQGLSLGKYEILKYLSSDVTQEDIKEMKVADIVGRKDFKENTKNNNASLELVDNNEKDLNDDTMVMGEEDITQSEDDLNSGGLKGNSNSNINNKNNTAGKQSTKELSSEGKQINSDLEQENNGNSNNGKNDAVLGNSISSQNGNENGNSNIEDSQEQNENYNNQTKTNAKDNQSNKEKNNDKEQNDGKEQKQGKQSNNSVGDIENNSESQNTNNNQNEDYNINNNENNGEGGNKNNGNK